MSIHRTRAISGIDLLFLIGAITVAAALRLVFLLDPEFVLDSDEAIVGLMAKHMAEGKGIPVFYYGQHYMGSLEPLIAAAAFSLFGVSEITLQMVPLFFGLMLIPCVYWLGMEVGGRTAARVAALLLAVPPVGLIIWSLKARGGFIEVVFIGTVALIVCCRWLKSFPRVRPLTILLGLLIGVGWWVNNQIIYYALPIACFCAARLLTIPGLWNKVRAASAELMWGVLAFLIGGAPFWFYNFERGFPSFGMFGRAPLREIGEHIAGLFSTALPILLGAKQFWQNEDVFPWATTVAYLCYGLVFGSLLWTRRERMLGAINLRLDWARPVELLFLFILTSCAVFVVSTFGWLVQAPRYLLPIYSALFVLFGLGYEIVARRSRALAVVLLCVTLGINLASSFDGGKAIPGEPFVFDNQRVSRDHTELIAALDANGYTLVRTNYWIGYRLAFETGERVRFGVIQEPYTVRIPEYQEEVERHPEPLEIPLILVPRQAALVERGLKALGYEYEALRVSGYVLIHKIVHDEPPSVECTKGSTVFASTNPDKPPAMIDSDLSTRWGTAHPQEPGQSFTVEFSEARPLTSFRYRLGHWFTDYARGLSIMLQYADGTFKEIISADNYYPVRYLTGSESEMKIYLDGKPVQRIVFVQTGRDPIFDWSIAELNFYCTKT